jgi:hypothetical protein
MFQLNIALAIALVACASSVNAEIIPLNLKIFYDSVKGGTCKNELSTGYQDVEDGPKSE